MDGLTGYIAALSMNMSQQNIQTNYATGMMKKVMDAQEQQGNAIADMLASMPSPDGKGMVLDMRA